MTSHRVAFPRPFLTPLCVLALACLFYTAGVASVHAHKGAQRHSGGTPMKVDEFVEILEAAYPWTVEKSKIYRERS
jgi:hypothetical protein